MEPSRTYNTITKSRQSKDKTPDPFPKRLIICVNHSTKNILLGIYLYEEKCPKEMLWLHSIRDKRVFMKEIPRLGAALSAEAKMSFELLLLILIGPVPVPLQCSVDNLRAEPTKRSRMQGVL
jgi:hypothetical protein